MSTTTRSIRNTKKSTAKKRTEKCAWRTFSVRDSSRRRKNLLQICPIYSRSIRAPSSDPTVTSRITKTTAKTSILTMLSFDSTTRQPSVTNPSSARKQPFASKIPISAPKANEAQKISATKSASTTPPLHRIKCANAINPKAVKEVLPPATALAASSTLLTATANTSSGTGNSTKSKASKTSPARKTKSSGRSATC